MRFSQFGMRRKRSAFTTIVISLAGLFINESESCHDILTRILPIRDIFVAILFASIGLLVQPASLASRIPTILVLEFLVVVGNFGIGYGVVRAAGYAAETAGFAALGLTQIGKFSYVLAGVGLREGLIGAPVQQGVLATSAFPWASACYGKAYERTYC
jgi:monovalent cation:H+ antiporter-2, CPA2 family